ALRFVNIPLAAWIAIAPWLLGDATTAGRWSGLLVGIMLIALSIPRGAVRERYGGWQRYVV
ncbi:MAG: vitamin K epoxide reductase family protein, partial [Longimicrobiales bacterium]